jgi:hypothetical protein
VGSQRKVAHGGSMALGKYRGDGDGRIIPIEHRDAIWATVGGIGDFGRPLPGYFMSVRNQVPWTLTPVGIKMYFEPAADLPRCDL